jgi:hypothetical protein
MEFKNIHHLLFFPWNVIIAHKTKSLMWIFYFWSFFGANYIPAKASTFPHLQKKIQKITEIIDSIQSYLKSQKTHFGTLVL